MDKNPAKEVVITTKKTVPSVKKNLKYMRDKDRELVKGIFRFHEVPGGIMSFVYRAYKEDPVERYDLVDGEVYSLPLGVAKHLNKNVWYPVHAHRLNDEGKVATIIGRKVKRCSFQSLEFIDIDELDDSLIEEVTVTKIPLQESK